MAETETIVNPGESSPSPFAPSLMSQAKELLGNPETLAGSSSMLPVIDYKPEDLEGIFSMPFDCAAFITKIEDLELTKKELEQLCRIWHKPFQTLAQKYPSFPWVIAGSLTMGIITEKVLIYYIATAERKQQRSREANASDTRASKVEEIASASRAGA